MTTLSVLKTPEDDQKQKVADLIRSFMDDADAGKFSGVFIVGRYAKDASDEEGMSHRYGRSGSFDLLEAIGFLELFKASMINEVKS